MAWELYSYVHRNGSLEVANWYESLRLKAKAKAQVKIEYLIDQPRENWTRPRFDLLHGDAIPLGEIILKEIDGKQTRLVGFFDKFHRCRYIIVTVVTKKQKIYTPKGWEDTSLRRMREIELDPRRANEWIP
jgi:hypothetical protein